jgi:branched-chain amino acid transport system substrate-binding protein
MSFVFIRRFVLFALSGSVFLAQAQQLSVGQFVPMSGPLANVGREISSVTKAVFDDYNKSARGVQIQLLSQDDSNNPEKTAELARAAGQNASAFLSCFGSVGCLAQQKVSQELRIPLLGPIAGAAPLRGNQAVSTYAVRASAAQEVQAALRYSNTVGFKRLTVVVQDDGFGKSYAAELDRMLAEYPAMAVQRVTFAPAKPDYAALATAAIAQQGNALLLFANAVHSTGLLTAWKEQNSLPFVLNMAGQANSLYASRLKGYTGASAFAVVTPSPWEQKLLAQREYQRISKDAGLQLSYLGFEAYLNAKLLVDAVGKGNARSSQDIAKYLSTTKEIDLGGYTVSYAGERLGSRFTDLSLLRSDGTFRH